MEACDLLVLCLSLSRPLRCPDLGASMLSRDSANVQSVVYEIHPL
jgi:hypothetical protein